MDAISIYRSEQVSQSQALFYDILQSRTDHYLVSELLHPLGIKLLEAYEKRFPIAATLISNHHPNYLGQSIDTILAAPITQADIFLSIAREYGFKSWETVKGSSQVMNHDFERALDLLLGGQLEALQHFLAQHPYLIRTHSHFGHKAGLIHYIGTNGIELHRQQIPENLVEVATFLLTKGADPSMPNCIYGGTSHVASLIETSTHSWDSGLGDSLLALFPDYPSTSQLKGG